MALLLATVKWHVIWNVFAVAYLIHILFRSYLPEILVRKPGFWCEIWKKSLQSVVRRYIDFTAKYCPLCSYYEYISLVWDYLLDVSGTWQGMHFFGHGVQGFFLIQYLTNNWVNWLENGTCPLFCLRPCSVLQLTNSVWSTNVERMKIAVSLHYVVTMETCG
jgi:hypothetical protein